MNEKLLAKIQELPVPVKIIIEIRKHARIALKKNQIIIRIPKGMTSSQRDKSTQELIQWATKTISEKQLYSPTHKDSFLSGNTIQILGQNYQIEQHFVAGDRLTLRFSPQNTIKFYLPIHLSNHQEDLYQESKDLLIKGLNRYFLLDIQKRVKELNQQYFQADLNKITLRYTTSRWGSCSSTGAISLSTRLLLVPPEVCDYVILHELAHRFEMNHSDRFWALVEKAMPEYRKHLQWLKKESGKLLI
ncbi:MAG: M48 family metallopeptidase [Chitinophagales bacterium]|nr:M48 family metallopeptidase [Chitinophagales bacterium]MCZ2393456.1 M48 family metallopeptidase [Chitinophagales bacterium]